MLILPEPRDLLGPFYDLFTIIRAEQIKMFRERCRFEEPAKAWAYVERAYRQPIADLLKVAVEHASMKPPDPVLICKEDVTC